MTTPGARGLVVAVAALANAACSTGGLEPVSFDAAARGASTHDFEVDGVTVRLDDARVAIGPAYFCAAQSGSATLCETAVAELARTRAVDLLAERDQPLGRVDALEGNVQSASFDYGVHWFLTESDVTAAVEAPDGHSLVLAGELTRGLVKRPFRARVDVEPPYQGQRSVASTPVSASIDAGTRALDVRFPLAAWLAVVDWGGALDEAAALPEGASLEIDPGSLAANALVVAMTTRPATFDFR